MAAFGRRWVALCALLFLTLCGTSCVLPTGVSAEVAKPPSPPTSASASHILVDTEAEADAIMAQLEGHPQLLVEFAKVAQEKSKCPSGKKGGSLGSFGRGRMVPEFDRAVFEQEPHRLYKVQTQFGWHVIYTTQLGEGEGDDSAYRTFVIIMNKAAPFITPLLLIVIMLFGQRAANKTKGPLARASHILVDTEKEADELLKQIQSAEKPKAKLEELARAKSKCNSKKKGGDLGLFGRGQMVPPFEKIAFEKDVDSVHKVQTQFGWHVIMVTDRIGEKKNN
ncbi:hypothetical protein PINS_up008323 [Pythium insidiosum]|nr:hypothetical protein PINS_up008323 [Pythium insidiosum]